MKASQRRTNGSLLPVSTVAVKKNGHGQEAKKKANLYHLNENFEESWYVPENYKKDICDYWFDYCCRKGNKCTFAHGYGDLAKSVKICKNPTNCPKALNYTCKYRHDV
jgi:hypothetical protein